MTQLRKIACYGFVVASLQFCTFAAVAADEVVRTAGGNPKSPISEAVTVPLGDFNLYFISGTPAAPADPTAPVGSAQRMGDTITQTVSSLTRIESTMTKLGLTFGDVVKATVFLVGDPAKDGEIDFAGMNQEWSKKFGTAEQPNKPARSTVKVAGLPTRGGLVEIEIIAVKKK